MENDKLVRLSDVFGKCILVPHLNGAEAVMESDLYDLPAVDAVEVRHGRWIECEDATLDVYYKCSVCGNEWDIIEGTPEDNNMKYCPECGARMDGEEEHNAAD